MNAKSTAKQIENLRMAYAIMAGFPAHKIDLGLVRHDPTDFLKGRLDDDAIKDVKCNTCGCIAGVLSAHPYFIAQGFKSKPDIDLRADQALFGASFVFNGGPDGIEGKRFALFRIRQALSNHGAISITRNNELEREEAKMER